MNNSYQGNAEEGQLQSIKGVYEGDATEMEENGSETVSPKYPVEVCMSAANPVLPMFLYKFMDDTDNMKCFKFYVKNGGGGQYRCSNMDFATVCTGCTSIYEKARRQSNGSSVHRTTKRTDGYNMLSDPHAFHVPGCNPLDYDDVIDKYPLIKEEVKVKIIKGNDRSCHLYTHGSPFPAPIAVEVYPVAMVMRASNPIHPLFLYRLKDQPDRCYKFAVRRYMRCVNGDFVISCSCSRQTRKTDGHHMRSDPNSGHQPRCKPLDYEECLKKYPLVKAIVRHKIIAGENVDMHMPPNGTPFPSVKVEGAESSDSELDYDDIFGYSQHGDQGTAVHQVIPTGQTTGAGRKDERESAANGDAIIARRQSLPRRAKKRRNVIIDSDSSSEDDSGKVINLITYYDNSPTSNGTLIPSAVSTTTKGSALSSSATVPSSLLLCDHVDILASASDQTSNDIDGAQLFATVQIKKNIVMQFEKKFKTLDFEEKDLKVSVRDGTTLKVYFERKAVTIGDTSQTLIYSVLFPYLIDDDSLTTSWEEGTLVVRGRSRT